MKTVSSTVGPHTLRLCVLLTEIVFLFLSATAYGQSFECDTPPAEPGTIASVQAVLGEIKVLVILYNYAYDHDICPHPPPLHTIGTSWSGVETEIVDAQQARGYFFDDRYPAPWAHDTVNDWYREVSGDRARITGDVAGYFTLSIDCHYPLRDAVIEPCLTAAANAGFDIHQTGTYTIEGAYDKVVFVSSWPSGGSSASGIPGAMAWIRQLRVPTAAHELGHTLGLYHDDDWDCGSAILYPAPGAPPCADIGGGNVLSVMGMGTGHIIALAKMRLGWLDPSAQVTVTGHGAYSLSPLEGTTGLRLLTIPRLVDGGYYWIDFRRAVGFDANPEMALCLDNCRAGDCCGASVYADPNPFVPGYALLLDMTPNSSVSTEIYDSGLLPGLPYVDELNDVCIFPVGITGDGLDAQLNLQVGCDFPLDCNHNGVYDALDLYYGTSVDCNMNGVPDECDGRLCPQGTILSASPPAWTVDARQPHGLYNNSFELRQGIGSRNSAGTYAYGPEPIVITLDVQGVLCPACWGLCETGIEQVKSGGQLSPNRIFSVTERANQPGVYEILLDRPISAGHWTTIRYLGGGDSVTYGSLPGNSNGDRYSTGADILDLIDCCLNHICTPAHGLYSCDIDNYGEWTSLDTQRLVDLLNGAGTFITWYGRGLPGTTCTGQTINYGGGGGDNCADASCGGGMDPLAMTPVGGSGGDAQMLMSTNTEAVVVVDESARVTDWFVNYLTTASPTDSATASEFNVIAESLSQWCASNFTSEERAALAARLCDPLATFASPSGADAAAAAASVIAP